MTFIEGFLIVCLIYAIFLMALKVIIDILSSTE